jgi:hypothetical protein
VVQDRLQVDRLLIAAEILQVLENTFGQGQVWLHNDVPTVVAGIPYSDHQQVIQLPTYELGQSLHIALVDIEPRRATQELFQAMVTHDHDVSSEQFLMS